MSESSPDRASDYNPSKATWKELRWLEDRIQSLSTLGPKEKIGKHTFRLNIAEWGAEDELLQTLWRGRGKFYNRLRVFSEVIVGRLVTVDPLTEGLASADGGSQIRVGYTAVSYLYSSLTQDILSSGTDVRYHFNPDIEHPGSQLVVASDFKAVSDQVGNTVTKDEWDRLIAELGRGASGEFAINPTEA